MDIKGFGISGQQSSVESIVTKLKFISRLKEGDKIDIRTMTVVKNDYISRLSRHMSGCRRDDSLQFIRDTINSAIELAQYYFSVSVNNPFNQDVGKLIIENIKKSYDGIKNQMKTYADDSNFVSDLETVIETTNIKLGEK
jgi:hypothetical protein